MYDFIINVICENIARAKKMLSPDGFNNCEASDHVGLLPRRLAQSPRFWRLRVKRRCHCIKNTV